jgi:hypothetical protein
MKPEHRHLVPNLYKRLGPEAVANGKKFWVHQLIVQNDYRSRNAVLILHGLAAKGDEAAVGIFDADEYQALLNIPGNYDRGRNILLGLGLLPKERAARPPKPISELKTIIANMLRDTRDESESDPRVAGLEEEKKSSLLITLTLLRVELARAQLSQIYGETESNEVRSIFETPDAIREIDRFAEVAGVVKKMEPGTPIDFALLDSVMNVGGIAPQTEEQFEKDRPFIEMAVEWINKERVEFLDYFRFMMRAIANPYPQIASESDQQLARVIRDMYERKGSQVGLAEQLLYFEDWVGTDIR